MKASNGYSLFVIGVLAHKKRPANVTLFVTGKASGAFYSAPATVTKSSIQANLGALGEISVSFHPSGQPKTVRSKCGGRPVSFDSGSYEGTIAFHGEEGYADLEAASAPGDLGFLLDTLFCSGSLVGADGPGALGAQLTAYADGSRQGPGLQVVKNGPAARAHFDAGLSERRSGISIVRFVNAIAPASTFEYDPQVQAAVVRPPAPFSGTASFNRGAKPANRWTGNLTVDFPGRSGVKLTGPGALATLAHGHRDRHGASGSR